MKQKNSQQLKRDKFESLTQKLSPNLYSRHFQKPNYSVFSEKNELFEDNKENSQFKKPYRLDTQEILPNFRKNYEVFQLQDEIAQLKATIDIKNKQIFYLSSQAVSLKEQYTQKMLIFENTINDQKKELTDLRYLGLKDKRIDNKKNEKLVQQVKARYELEIKKIKKSYEDTIDKINLSHKKETQNISQKMLALLESQKRERKKMQQILDQKSKNQELIIEELRQQLAKKAHDQNQLNQELQTYQKVLQTIKLQLKNNTDKIQERQQQLILQCENFKGEKKLLQKKLQLSQQKLKANNSTIKVIQEAHNSQLESLTLQLKQLKQAFKEKDAQISRLSQNQKKSPKISEKKADLVKNCRHQGLIQQLQRNIILKNRQNEQLKQQLAEWGKYIGFEKTGSEKSLDLLNASSSALITQANFSNNLKKRASKL